MTVNVPAIILGIQNLHPGEAAEKSDSRIVADFDDYGVLIIRGGSVVNKETCKQSRSTEGMNFWT